MDTNSMSRRVKSIRRPALRQILPFFLLPILALWFVFAIHLARLDVVLIVDGESQVITSFSNDVAGLLQEANIVVGRWDKLSYEPEEKLQRGMTVELKTAYPITVYADGESYAPMVVEVSVKDVLHRLGVTLGDLDRVEPGLEHILAPGDVIDVIRVFRYLNTERTVIPFREIRQGNANMDRGETRVLQKGITGVREDTVEVTLENNREVAMVVLQSDMIRVKQDRVVEYGENTTLSRGSLSVSFDRVFQMSATAYCAGLEVTGCPIDDRGRSVCTGSNNNGLTATGVLAVAGTGRENQPHLVAVDPRVIPLGSRLYIDGYGFAVAVDTGSAIKSNRIDILFPTHEAALRFGRRKVRVYLLYR